MQLSWRARTVVALLVVEALFVATRLELTTGLAHLLPEFFRALGLTLRSRNREC